MFSQKTFEFLLMNRINNSREWFLEHKNDYNEHVLAPLTELAILLAPTVSAIDEKIITEPKVDKTISRIYRDTRFSKDKTLYRDEIWLSFRRDKKAFPQYPEFFFVVMPHVYIYGCGHYAAAADTMERVRNLILNNDQAFQKALKAFNAQSEFIIEGDRYKKSRYPEQPESIRSWLDRKSICIMVKSKDFTELYGEDLACRLNTTYKQMEDIYQFLVYAEEESRMKIHNR